MCIRTWSVVLILTINAAASAQPVWPAPPRIGTDPARDLRLTMQARKLLFEEPELAALNVGVVVNDRVAELWGPVPSVEAAFRAELVLRGMAELAQVHNNLFVGELEPIRRPLRMEVLPHYMPNQLPPKLPAEPRPIFGAPGILTGQSNKFAMLPAVTLGQPNAEEVDGDPDRELNAAVRTFLQSKNSYRTVEFTLKERRVYLKASDQDIDALHEAARGIARLPRVEGVILLDKASPR